MASFRNRETYCTNSASTATGTAHTHSRRVYDNIQHNKQYSALARVPYDALSTPAQENWKGAKQHPPFHQNGCKHFQPQVTRLPVFCSVNSKTGLTTTPAGQFFRRLMISDLTSTTKHSIQQTTAGFPSLQQADYRSTPHPHPVSLTCIVADSFSRCGKYLSSTTDSLQQKFYPQTQKAIIYFQTMTNESWCWGWVGDKPKKLKIRTCTGTLKRGRGLALADQILK